LPTGNFSSFDYLSQVASCSAPAFFGSLAVVSWCALNTKASHSLNQGAIAKKEN